MSSESGRKTSESHVSAGPQPEAVWGLFGCPAEPGRLRRMRRALESWAENVGMDSDQCAALGLASYEVLANACEHAYSSLGGVLDVCARYWSPSGQVEVLVRDYGRWRTPAEDDPLLRGRGLLLVQELAEGSWVTSDEHGTCVRMSWTVPSGCSGRRPSAVKRE